MSKEEKTNVSFRIGGVPEHFSIPIYEGVKNKQFLKRGLDVTFEEYPRGTGSMCAALAEKKIDVAIALTEGLVVDKIENDGNFKIVATYVASPLQWGAGVHPDAKFKSRSDLRDAIFGISRLGSGSHIMSYVLAKEEGWDASKLKFEVKGGLADLQGGIQDHSCSVFLWERFMLLNLVQQNKLKYAGFVNSPWPCFMIAVRNDVLESSKASSIPTLLSVIQESCASFMSSANLKQSLALIQERCHLNEEDAQTWLKQVKFSSDSAVSQAMLENTVNVLAGAHILKKKPKTDGFDVSVLVDKTYTKVVK